MYVCRYLVFRKTANNFFILMKKNFIYLLAFSRLHQKFFKKYHRLAKAGGIKQQQYEQQILCCNNVASALLQDRVPYNFICYCEMPIEVNKAKKRKLRLDGRKPCGLRCFLQDIDENVLPALKSLPRFQTFCHKSENKIKLNRNIKVNKLKRSEENKTRIKLFLISTVMVYNVEKKLQKENGNGKKLIIRSIFNNKITV